ncbi:sulfurtransferase [Chlorobaculum sp. 24CR]|uniref:rhodanese-like domain-containing protein n=1 Tax=Chlorobaculum sp. 24CR TaxID=2508878 RepID=UPI00100A82BE|nr:rhodanese-like domain-containing protein [Chlorobaculum sp. 24CR]RXK82722.1 sulfurtransferase [Chlorobaculum sp. 24CR]
MKKIVSLVVAFLLVSTSLLQAASFDVGALPKSKQTTAGKYLSAQDAYEMVVKNPGKALFVDVRTPAEIVYVGIADQVSLNIPYELDDFSAWDDKKNHYKMNVNPDFTRKVDDAMTAKGLGKSDPVILMCRSGGRSASAADLLTKAGYTNVYSVYDGFEGDKNKEGRREVNGWQNSGLPWSYKLDKQKAYLPK